MAIEKDPFIADLPMKRVTFHSKLSKLLVYQRVVDVTIVPAFKKTQFWHQPGSACGRMTSVASRPYGTACLELSG